MEQNTMRIDLHVHSKFSTRPSQWFLQKLGCPESFTEPLQIYKLAKDRGMSLVTISDHNNIDGALEIAHLPDTFVSEEITTYFPEDGCKLHVVAFNITEKQHREFQRLRENLFDLVAYLNQEKILHTLAHPLYSVNDKLTVDHFEKMLLLFKCFEINGAREDLPNQCLKLILPNLTPSDMERLADKHDIKPPFPEPWRKALTGGSDDHSSLNIARTYTEINGACDVSTALQGLEKGDTSVVSTPSTPMTLAHNLYGIAYQFYLHKFKLDRYANKDILLKFLDRSLRTDYECESSFLSRLCLLWNHRKRPKIKTEVPEDLQNLLQHETHKLICDDPQLMQITENGNGDYKDLENKWFYFVNKTSDKVLYHFANHIFDHFSGANVFNIFHSIGSAGGLYTLLAPYFISFSVFAQDRRFTRSILRRFPEKNRDTSRSHIIPTRENSASVAHFTDTFYEMNDVALTLRQQVEMAVKNSKKLTVVTCDNESHSNREGIRNFTPIGVYEIPECKQQKVFYPPFLEMLHYCYQQDFTQIHAATPGPIGLTALAIARILKLPISATYHNALPRYAQYLTGDQVIEDLTWKYVLWFYDQMDTIYTPSRCIKDELIQKGIQAAKIKVLPMGIDIERFHPSKRDEHVEREYGIGNRIKLLYVGRISREENMPLLTNVYKSLVRASENVHLIVVGDGPYLRQMQEELQGAPATFTGYLEGEELEKIYASSDVFVFPDTTETFANAVYQAQASGVPVIVTDKGGSRENIVPGETGLVARADDPASLLKAIQALVKEPQRMKAMGKAARRFMESHSSESAFIQTWKMFRDSGAESARSYAEAV